MAGTSKRKQTDKAVNVPSVVDAELVTPPDAELTREVQVDGSVELEGHPDLIKVHQDVVKAAKLGKSAETLGVVRVTSGYVLIHKNLLTELQRRVCAQAASATGDRLKALGDTAAKIANSVARLVKDGSVGGAGPKRGKPTRKGFSIGQPVLMQQNNYYGGAGPGKSD